LTECCNSHSIVILIISVNTQTDVCLFISNVQSVQILLCDRCYQMATSKILGQDVYIHPLFGLAETLDVAKKCKMQ